ncbi:MAG: riboflavin synthase [Longimicrobiales bacterium]|nr:riboflavin synthase [Longimicrobiales bacterium]
MFTGIIETVGTISSIRERSGTREFVVQAPEISSELKPGDSITVDGACQTAVRTDAGSFAIDTIGTTLSRTIARHYRVGSRVNLERSMVLGGRLDGHLVQGHVDGVGRLLSVRQEGDYWLLDFQVPELVAQVTILHGSITINGVSLTVNALPVDGQCQVGIIPFTWAHTNLGSMKPGDPVNLEGDLVGKYVAKLLSAWTGGGKLSLEGLAALGYGGDKV